MWGLFIVVGGGGGVDEPFDVKVEEVEFLG